MKEQLSFTEFRVLVKHSVESNESLLIKQIVYGGKTDSFALVVALNNELAHSISFELERQHSESPFLKGNINQEESRHEIIKSIEVRSLEQLLIEWMQV